MGALQAVVLLREPCELRCCCREGNSRGGGRARSLYATPPSPPPPPRVLKDSGAGSATNKCL